MDESSPPPDGVPRTVASVFLAWVVSVGFDLFLHAGLLRGHYEGGDPFILPPMEAFRRIPAGYLTFLVLTVSLYWLLAKLDVRGAARGARLGLVAGLVVWGALNLGLWSITIARPSLLVAWWLGQGMELGLAGSVLGAARAGTPLPRLAGRVAAAALLFVAAAVVLQNLP